MAERLTPKALAEIRARAEAAGGHAWKVEATAEFSGDNWLVASFGQHEDNLNYYVTTDRVHASEHCGTAKSEAEHVATVDPYTTLQLLAHIAAQDAELEAVKADREAEAKLAKNQIIEVMRQRDSLQQQVDDYTKAYNTEYREA